VETRDKKKDGSNSWRDVARFPTPQITVSGHIIFFFKSNLVAHSTCAIKIVSSFNNKFLALQNLHGSIQVYLK
jgi:hypothetical protein